MDASTRYFICLTVPAIQVNRFSESMQVSLWVFLSLLLAVQIELDNLLLILPEYLILFGNIWIPSFQMGSFCSYLYQIINGFLNLLLILPHVLELIFLVIKQILVHALIDGTPGLRFRTRSSSSIRNALTFISSILAIQGIRISSVKSIAILMILPIFGRFLTIYSL